jgi:hypothetical protein
LILAVIPILILLGINSKMNGKSNNKMEMFIIMEW